MVSSLGISWASFFDGSGARSLCVNRACQLYCQQTNEGPGEMSAPALFQTDVTCEVKGHQVCCKLASFTTRDLLAATLR
jgi:hypothetical protein